MARSLPSGRSVVAALTAALVSAACFDYLKPRGDYACERAEDCSAGWRCVAPLGETQGVCTLIDDQDAVDAEGTIATDDVDAGPTLPPDTLDGRWFSQVDDSYDKLFLQLDQSGMSVGGSVSNDRDFQLFSLEEGGVVDGFEVRFRYSAPRYEGGEPFLVIATLTYDPLEDLLAGTWDHSLYGVTEVLFTRLDLGPPLPADTLDGRWAGEREAPDEVHFELDQRDGSFTGTAGDNIGGITDGPIANAVLDGGRVAFTYEAPSVHGEHYDAVLELMYDASLDVLDGWWFHPLHSKWRITFHHTD